MRGKVFVIDKSHLNEPSEHRIDDLVWIAARSHPVSELGPGSRSRGEQAQA